MDSNSDTFENTFQNCGAFTSFIPKRRKKLYWLLREQLLGPEEGTLEPPVAYST